MACNCKPSAPRLAGNAAAAAGRIAGAALQGQPVLVNPNREAARLDVCRRCDRCQPHPPKPEYLRCGECGCWLNGKWLAKARLATENCPLGKWQEAGC